MLIKMNPGGRVAIFTFSIVVMSTIQRAIGQHQPLYITKTSNGVEYDLLYDVKFNVGDEQFIVSESHGKLISLMCPRNDGFNSLQIQTKVSSVTSITPSCGTPVKSCIYMTEPAFDFLPNVIGFLVFVPGKPPSSFYADFPHNYALVEFIEFTFDEQLHRVKTVRHRLRAGRVLKPEISTENKMEEYEKDEKFFGFDVDLLYSRTSLLVVKIPLAPQDDFYFANLKAASRHNIITAPMWRDLLPQWQALEEFIRKVTQIIDSVYVKTGVYGTLTQPRIGRSPRILSLHDGKHPIPKYFWKAIYIEVSQFGRNRILGILFVMHNDDPNDKPDLQKICPNDNVSHSGWESLLVNRFKSLMYACSFNEANFGFFQEKFDLRNDYELFDLHDVPVNQINDEGDIIGTVGANVLEEIEKLKKAVDDFTVKHIASMKFLSKNV